MLNFVAIWAGAAIMVESALAQQLVPATIARAGTPETHTAAISWPTIPGRTYEIQTRDGLDAPWVSTNISAVKARTTRGSLEFGTQGDELPIRFYQVWEQAGPPANNAAFTAASVTEIEKMLGVTFTSSQRSQVLSGLAGNRAAFQTIRKTRLLQSDSLPLVFDPRPDGFTMDSTQEPIMLSPPKYTTVPANRAELAFYSARDLGELIRTRQITSAELTRLYLDRLKRHDRTLQCVITLTEELALKQAARADQELAAGKYRGPLHGLPYGIKDLFSVRGYRTTWGSSPFRDQMIDEDATVVKKLEEAGAVLVAKLSTGELAYGDQWFGGTTRNPWDTGSGSSGSSAGPAAATAAGLVAFSIGTETFGSILAPSMVCRVTGLRTTFGRISRAGAMSLSWSLDKVGPICRTVEDCALVLDAIRGTDGVDHAVIDAPFNYQPDPNRKKIRIGYRKGQISAAVVNRLAAIVGQEQMFEVQLPTNSVSLMLIMKVEAAASFDELVRFGGDAYVSSFWQSTINSGRSVPAVEYLQANRVRKKLIASMAELMTRIDVFVGTQADVLEGAAGEITNLTGHPCVAIPHGGGTSLGFIGRPFEEATILALAKAYQDATGFHTNRPPAFVR